MAIKTPKAPAAVGPYAQAMVAQGARLIFVSGQIPLDPQSMTVVGPEVRTQAIQVLKNLSAILLEAQASIHNVVKTTVYLKNMDDFAAVNEEYAKFFAEHQPARACVEVARLPRDVLVEIDAIAVA